MSDDEPDDEESEEFDPSRTMKSIEYAELGNYKNMKDCRTGT